jgi:hypothetical protein
MEEGHHSPAGGHPVTPSPRARALVEALHDVSSNEKRWEIVQKALDEERAETIRHVELGHRAIRLEIERREQEASIDKNRRALAGLMGVHEHPDPHPEPHIVDPPGDRDDDWGV